MRLGVVMGGSLFCGRSFRQEWYTGNDGLRHYEVMTEESHALSHSTWRELKEFFAKLGVPMEAWPVYEDNIDLPLSEIEARNTELRRHLAVVSLGEDAPYWSVVVFDAIRAGKRVFFTDV